MRSALPKVQHPVCGRPMLLWPIAAAQQASAEKVVVVLGPEDTAAALLPAGVDVAIQAEARGTGDAVRAAEQAVAGSSTTIILSGDTPLLTAEFVSALADHHSAGDAAMTIVTMTLADPTGYGRVVRDADGNVTRVAETKVAGDAGDAELQINEVNAGIYAFDTAALFEALAEIGANNAQGEYYLPDVLGVFRSQRRSVTAFNIPDPEITLGVNSRVDLGLVQQALNRRLIAQHQLNGVTFVNPASTVVEHDVEIGQDAVIEPGTMIRNGSRVGAGALIGPNTTLTNAVVADGASVIHSYLLDCKVGPNASVGPFAYLRPGAELGENSKAGTFVEIKNSRLGDGAKVPHLSYIGDADVGAGSNLGAATITANYDGRNKHRTEIGEGVRTGVDTTLVAPVSVGDGAYTGAGSVITEDVPERSLAIARARQEVVEGYADRDGDRDSSKNPGA